MQEKYLWKTSDIFENEIEFNDSINEVKKKVVDIEKFKGNLNDASKIYECFFLNEQTDEILAKIYAYAMLIFHEDTSNQESIKRYKLVEDLCNDCAIKTSFITPELQKLSIEELKELISKEPRLERYKRDIDHLIEFKPHVLSEKEESLFTKVATTFSSCESIFDVLTDTDFKFPDIVTKDRQKLELTHGTYIKYLESKDPYIRKQAFENMYSVFAQYNNTLAEMFIRHVKTRTIMAEIKNYTSSLEKSVKLEESTIDVYNKLVETVNKNLDFNHRYISFKKKQLNLNEMHMYDLFVDITKKEENTINYEEAKNIVKESLAILGEEYINNLTKAMEERWIHVYEQKAKRSGAYSMGVYGVHPFVLLNYVDNIESVSTLAHELGHAMHSYYSSNSQTYNDSDYTIMVAEVASTVNETLLAEYLINKETDKIKKASLINTHINGIRSTLVRQTMFAEFEKIAHRLIEEGNQLSAEDLNQIYYDLNKKYFGDDIIVDEPIKYEWSRIPHFYSSFYVYKYATGISSAIAIAKNILEGKEGYKEKYIEMLKMGGSVKALDQLKSVGVDLTTEKPIQDAFDYLNDKLNQLEELMK